MIKRHFLFFFFLVPFALNAQVEFGSGRSNGMEFDNDVFFKTDKYYTTGLKLYHQSPKLINLFNRDKIKQERLSLNHKIFTPTNFNEDIPDFDRPFVSSLTFAYSSTTSESSKKLRTKHRLELGLQGKNSGGRTVQNFIHWLLPASDKIEDWKYQLNTDIVINYSFYVEKGLINKNWLMLNAFGQIQAGTPSLASDFGAHIRVGKLFDRFQFLDYSRDDWSLFVYTKPFVRLTAYNTFLQGGPFTHGQEFTLDKVNNAFYQVETGLFWSIKRWAFDVSFTYQSSQAMGLTDHRWGSIRFNYLLK